MEIPNIERVEGPAFDRSQTEVLFVLPADHAGVGWVGCPTENFRILLFLLCGAEALAAADRLGAGGFGVDLLDAILLGGIGDQGPVLTAGRGGEVDAAVGGHGDGPGVEDPEVILLWADGVEGG